MRYLIFIFSLFLCWFAISPAMQAQTDPRFYEYPYNHLDWYTIEGEHFMIHFQKGNERSAQVVSRIAEEIYEPITSLYRYEPDEKVSIVLKDREDYSNGAAYFFDNKIDIWLPALNTPLRGTHNWLRNVITHEFTHIVQIQAGLKRKRKVPALYLQWLSYENLRRPDVLFGFPNGIVSLPFASVNIPAWLAEGTAQYQRAGLRYESWDSHRDMILRTRIMTGTHFELTDMGTFASKNSLERETVYNQGYAFTIYLAYRFGEDVLRKITEQLGEKGVYSVEEAIERSTGIPGKEVFDDWVAERKDFYDTAMSEISYSPSETVEGEGFYNFFPKRSPNGDILAYTSNRGRDYSLLSLYLKSEDGDQELVLSDVDPLEGHAHHAHALEPVVPFISTSYSFAPDSKRLVYSVNKKNAYGELYRDLFVLNIETKDQQRLTHSGRIESPTWGPDGNEIAAVKYSEGTQNLALVYPDHQDSVQILTDYRNGETIYTPTWDQTGSVIYFAMGDEGVRRIMKYDLATDSVSTVLSPDLIDVRDPFIGDDGYLYYASDPDGIFNIYRMPLDGGLKEKMTSVQGGAFMPFMRQDVLYFSEYEVDGYHIKKVDMDLLLTHQSGQYQPEVPEFTFEPDSLPAYQYLNVFDDTDLNGFDPSSEAIADTGSYAFTIRTEGASPDRTYRKYEDTFTKFSFFPVLRFDNYTKLNGPNGSLIRNARIGDLAGNLWRDVKPGVYFSSREVIDRLTVFGGALIGPGSRPAESIGGFFQPNRLIRLDRDIFFIAEYRGLPFIEKSWSPTIAVEVFNLHRNVNDGLSIEEFPCTSCLPDTSSVDIGYEIWEANVFLRSKLSRRSLLELGVGYSPFRVLTDNFFSRELQTLVSGSSSQYFRGTRFSASYTFDYYEFTKQADIAPLGLKGYLRYQYQPSELLEEYTIEDGALVPIFEEFQNHSAEMHVRYGFRTFGGQSFQARVRGFTYFNQPRDAFFADFVGGFLGLRSYPFFALGGNTTAFSSLSWFMPILQDMDYQVGPYIFDKMYARFFFETGNGWYTNNAAAVDPDLLFSGNNLKSGIGAELRVASSGYYLFPLKFFVSAAYGFNEFSLTLPDDFVTAGQGNRVTYGREILFHFGLTFDFELL